MNDRLQQVIELLIKIKAVEDSETIKRLGSQMAIEQAIQYLKQQQAANDLLE